MLRKTELKRSTKPLQRKTPLKAKRSRPRTHKFIVRLTGPALEKLRHECFLRDRGRCRECGQMLHYIAMFLGDPLAYEMAHIRSRGAGGGDEIQNVRSLCHEDHMREHNQGRASRRA